MRTVRKPSAPALRGGLVFLGVLLTALFPHYASSANRTAPGSVDPAAILRAYYIEHEDGGAAVAQGNPDRRVSVASATKLVTALVARSMLRDDDLVTVPGAATRLIGARIGLTAGERYRVIDLLHGMLMESGNDAAYSIAVRAAGSPARFAARMNEWCRANGFPKSSFADPAGLNRRSASTARELVGIFRAFQSDPALARIITLKRHTIHSAGGRSIELNNSNYFIRYFRREFAGKTGYTRAAGSCYVGWIKNGADRYYVAFLGARKGWQEQDVLFDALVARNGRR